MTSHPAPISAVPTPTPPPAPLPELADELGRQLRAVSTRLERAATDFAGGAGAKANGQEDGARERSAAADCLHFVCGFQSARG